MSRGMFGRAMTRLAITDILAKAPVDAERHLDPARVDFYRRAMDRFRPVVVFETEDGLLLVDGYHRVAAAVREGRETIEAEVRPGSRTEALEYAAALGARQRDLSPEEVEEHIIRRYGSWTTERGR